MDTKNTIKEQLQHEFGGIFKQLDELKQNQLALVIELEKIDQKIKRIYLEAQQ